MPSDFMPTTDDGDLLRLASAWCDEAITDSELAKLQAALAADPQARLQFISYMQVHGGIKTEIVGKEHIESFVPLPGLGAPAPPTTDTPTQHFLQFRRWLGFRSARVAWAAALLIAVLGTGIAWYLHTRAAGFRSAPDHQTVVHNQRTLPQQIDPRDALARVAEQSSDCQWYFDRSGTVPTDMIRSGETVRVTNGMMKLVFDSVRL